MSDVVERFYDMAQNIDKEKVVQLMSMPACSPLMLGHFDLRFRDDIDVIGAGLRDYDDSAIFMASGRIKSDPDTVLALIKREQRDLAPAVSRVYQQMNYKLSYDRNFKLRVIEQTPEVSKSMSLDTRKDAALAVAALIAKRKFKFFAKLYAKYREADDKYKYETLHPDAIMEVCCEGDFDSLETDTFDPPPLVTAVMNKRRLLA